MNTRPELIHLTMVVIVKAKMINVIEINFKSSNLSSTSKIQTRFARTRCFVFEVMNTIFHYDDLVLISLNDKIIRYMFQAKNQMFLFFFNYLEDKYLSFIKIQI